MLGKNVYETSLKKEESSIQLSELVAKGIFFLQLADSQDRVIGTQKIILE
jgi:hypothetical protein